ncbi:hypothetical protein [Bacillus cereus]|uniref:hypothetical protein n=1 Tax=Bacillus cereus TaxID=1396 RepID=UPI002ABFDC3E|nr:hypothetical protein [Bacillus cereus]MDZ4467976.1 hypothetical protein [Bacillus cereus]MDZ4526792.1 hypothetical protein [Bacillus cereus]
MDLELKEFCNMMGSKFNVVVREEEVGWENVEHYQDELDTDLIPKIVYKYLPDPCLFQVMIFTDKNLNDWMSIVPIHPSTKERLYIIWLKNSEVVGLEKIKGEK